MNRKLVKEYVTEQLGIKFTSARHYTKEQLELLAKIAVLAECTPFDGIGTSFAKTSQPTR